MTGINTYSTTASNNTMYVPEGCAPSVVNDGIRQVQADTRTWYNDAEWLNLGDTPTYVSASSFTIPTDKTSFYTVGRRIKIADSSTLYGTIASSSYSAPNTTVGVTLDSGSISASISTVSVGIVKVPAGGTGSSLTGSGYVTTNGTETLTNKTLTAPKVNLIADTNGNEEIIFTTTASAVNEFTVINAATGTNPILSATGGDTNIGVDIQPKGTGVVNIKGTATAPAEIRLFEDTDNGTNYIGLKSPASVSANATFELPAADGTNGQALVTNGSKVLSFASVTGKLVNITRTALSTATTGAGTIPLDSTLPQNTEGTEFITHSHTPASASNILQVEALLWLDNDTTASISAGLFQDSTASALTPASMTTNGSANVSGLYIKYFMTAGTTSATTFKVRAGGSSGTTYFNQNSSSNTLGGLTSYIVVTEYTP